MTDVERLSIERLDVDNYATWSTRMRMLLVSKGLWTAVKGQLSVDSSADEKALAFIGLCVRDHHLPTIAGCETAKEAWEALEAVYQARSTARRLQLRRELNSLRKRPDEELTKYVARAKDIRDQLAAAGKGPDDQEVTMSLLAGLPSEYDVLVTVLETSDTPLDPDSVLAKLLTVEQRAASAKSAAEEQAFYSTRQRGSFAAKRSGGEPRECYYCGKQGHFKRECRQKARDGMAKGVRPAGAATWTENVALSAVATSGREEWVLDSGASQHITNDVTTMLNVRPVSKDVTIRFGDGGRCKAEAIGDVDITSFCGGDVDTVTLTNVLYVPAAVAKLVSISKAVHNGIDFRFRRDKCEVWKDSLLVANAAYRHGVYSLQLEQLQLAGQQTPWELFFEEVHGANATEHVVEPITSITNTKQHQQQQQQQQPGEQQSDEPRYPARERRQPKDWWRGTASPAPSSELGTLVEVLEPKQADKRSGALDVELASLASSTTWTTDNGVAIKGVNTPQKVYVKPDSDYEDGDGKDQTTAVGEFGEDFIAYAHKGSQLEPKPPDERGSAGKLKLQHCNSGIT